MIGIAGIEAKENNALVSGNAGDEKNRHPGGRIFFFNFRSTFWRYSLFFISFFYFFYSWSFVVVVVCLLLFELKNLDSDTYSSFLRVSDKNFFTRLISGN